jgi:hypothetical protein
MNEIETALSKLIEAGRVARRILKELGFSDIEITAMADRIRAEAAE